MILVEIPIIRGRAFVAIRDKMNRALRSLHIGDVSCCLATADFSLLYRLLDDDATLNLRVSQNGASLELEMMCKLSLDMLHNLDEQLHHFKLSVLSSGNETTTTVRLLHHYPASRDPRMEEAKSILETRTTEEIRHHATRTEQHLASTQQQLKVVERDLQVAADIQQHMLPSKQSLKSIHPDLDCHAYIIPCRDIGGDLFDVIPLSSDQIAVAVGDVSGKGVPAAMMMATCTTLIRAYFETNNSPGSIMSKINKRLSEGNEEDCMFTTLFLGLIDHRNNTITFSNAGHNPGLIIRSDDKIDILEHIHGPALGVFSDHAYSEQCSPWNPGERLVLYTDGASESFSEDGELYGFERILHYCQQSSDALNSRRFLSGLLLNINQHAGTEHAHDDVTLVTLKRNQLQPSITLDASRLLTGSSNNITELKQHVEQSCEALGVAPETLSKTLLIVDELLANISSHASKSINQTLEITIQLHDKHSYLQLTISDNGAPFNPLLTDAPDTSLCLDERDEGGLGLFFVKHLADAIDYKRDNGLNQLSIMLLSESGVKA